jgi:hypothetical protein
VGVFCFAQDKHYHLQPFCEVHIENTIEGKFLVTKFEFGESFVISLEGDCMVKFYIFTHYRTRVSG